MRRPDDCDSIDDRDPVIIKKFGRHDDVANIAIGIVLILGVVLEINGFAVFGPCLAEGP